MDHSRSLKAQTRSGLTWTRAAATLALFAAGAWFFAEPTLPEHPRVADGATIAPSNLPLTESQRAPLREAPAKERVLTASIVVEKEEVIAGPRDENLVPGAKPHPITSEHRALHREVDLVESTWTALERRDFVEARALIEEHRSTYSGKNDDLDEGMLLLADCMQHPSDETRGRARRFYDEETYSTARRRIRRWCLDL